MENQILERLNLVRQRQRLQAGLQLGTFGMIASNSLALIAYLVIWFSPGLFSPYAIWGMMLLGPVFGFALGYLLFQPWSRAAAAVDQCYQLKDRTLSALEFSQHLKETPLEQLQIEDALSCIENIEAEKVVPYHVPRQFPYALAMLAVVGLFILFPGEQQQLAANVIEPNLGLIQVAEEIKEDINQLEEWAEENNVSEEVKELLDQLKEDIAEMEQPDVDVKEALAKISEMQAALAAQQAEYNPEAVNAQAQALGAAMMAADQLKSAALKLEAKELDAAAKEFEKLENVKLKRQEAKAVSERMKKLAKKMKESGLGQLSNTTSEMSDSLSSGDSKGFGQGGKKMAKHLQKHSLRNKLNRLLAMQLAKLGMKKSQCKSCGNGACKNCGSSSCSGSCSSNKNSFAQGQTNKNSKSPSNSFGMKTNGNLYGDKTKIDSNRNMKNLTGQAGDGPSETETSNSPEGQEVAGRSYKEVYSKYQKISEAVLESEPIPLGHRQTIQRYFELIRPGNTVATEAAQTETAPE